MTSLLQDDDPREVRDLHLPHRTRRSAHRIAPFCTLPQPSALIRRKTTGDDAPRPSSGAARILAKTPQNPWAWRYSCVFILK
jgi:hypothetical protein